MAERLLGIETEYAFSAFDRAGRPVDRFAALLGMLRLARAHYPALSDGSGRGVFLGNSSRFYLDAPDHPEYSTPECANPWDVVRYAGAGEQILQSLATRLVSEHRRIAETVILRCNVDYSGSGSTWGCHESYLHRCSPRLLPAALLPHLVSRVIYTGAGGFDSRARYGLRFSLSPRVAHLEREISDQSTAGRGIFHTKDEPLSSEGNHRLHLLCGESNCSQTAAWLKVATTALVVAMVDGGVRFDHKGDPKSPLEAMRLYAGDPTCTVVAPTVAGGEASALDIQWRYQRLAETVAGRSFMPSWAAEVCGRWRAVLEQLSAAPGAVSATLDWAIKYALYSARVAKRGLSWRSIGVWNEVLAQLAPHWDRAGEGGELSLAAARQAGAPLGAALARLEPRLGQAGLSWGGLDDFLALRRELCEIDARYGQLGDRSIFASLDAAGVLRHRVPGVEPLDSAVLDPPAGSRATARGRAVHLLADKGESLTCDWAGIWHGVGDCVLDLSDPFHCADEVTEATLEARLVQVRGTRKARRRGAPEGELGMHGAFSASVLEDLGDVDGAEVMYRRELRQAERRCNGESAEVALACNQFGVFLRGRGRLDEAEVYQRRALELDERLRGESDAKIPHRLNNLAVVLVLQGKLDEAIPLLARAWRLKAGQHDLTSARVLWVRIAAAMCRGDAVEFYLGQLKTLLLDDPALATTGGVSATWQIEPVIDQLGLHLRDEQIELLVTISAVFEDRALAPDLDRFLEWEGQPPLDPNVPWTWDG